MLKLSAERSRVARKDFVPVERTEEHVRDGGCEGWIDALIPHGSGRSDRRRGRQHLAAGADQVCLQTAGASGVPREQWDLLAEVLIT